MLTGFPTGDLAAVIETITAGRRRHRRHPAVHHHVLGAVQVVRRHPRQGRPHRPARAARRDRRHPPALARARVLAPPAVHLPAGRRRHHRRSSRPRTTGPARTTRSRRCRTASSAPGASSPRWSPAGSPRRRPGSSTTCRRSTSCSAAPDHRDARRHRPVRAAQRRGLRRLRRGRRLVGPPAPVRAVRSRRLLRHVAVAARARARRGVGPPGRAHVRARRGLVLGLRGRGVRASRAASTSPLPCTGRSTRPPPDPRAACRPTGGRGSTDGVSLGGRDRAGARWRRDRPGARWRPGVRLGARSRRPLCRSTAPRPRSRPARRRACLRAAHAPGGGPLHRPGDHSRLP